MRSIRNRLVLGAAALALGLVLAACGGGGQSPTPTPTATPSSGGQTPTAQATGTSQASDWQAQWNDTLAKAKSEGTVIIVTHTSKYYQQVVNDFQKAYPDIKVQQVADRPSDYATKVITEHQNGVFSTDVWLSPTSNMQTLALPAGVFQPTAPFLIEPSVTDPSNWAAGKITYTDPTQQDIAVYEGPVQSSIYVNRDKVAQSVFNSPADLLNPALKGQIGIRTPTAPHAGSLTLAGLLHKRGVDFVKQLLTTQQPQFIDNAVILTQQLIQGAIPVVMGQDASTISTCTTAGGCTNLQVVDSDPYFLANGVGVLAHAPHPAAAAVFVNWFLSQAGQQSWVNAVVANTSSTDSSRCNAQSARVDVQPDPAVSALHCLTDWTKLDQYSDQGMASGSAEMDQVINLYKSISGG